MGQLTQRPLQTRTMQSGSAKGTSMTTMFILPLGALLVAGSTIISTHKTSGDMYYRIIIIWKGGDETYMYVHGDQVSRDEVKVYENASSVISCRREQVSQKEYLQNTIV